MRPERDNKPRATVTPSRHVRGFFVWEGAMDRPLLIMRIIADVVAVGVIVALIVTIHRELGRPRIEAVEPPAVRPDPPALKSTPCPHCGGTGQRVELEAVEIK